MACNTTGWSAGDELPLTASALDSTACVVHDATFQWCSVPPHPHFSLSLLSSSLLSSFLPLWLTTTNATRTQAVGVGDCDRSVSACARFHEVALGPRGSGDNHQARDSSHTASLVCSVWSSRAVFLRRESIQAVAVLRSRGNHRNWILARFLCEFYRAKVSPPS